MKASLSFLILFAASFSFAAPVSQHVPYYGERFYSTLSAPNSSSDDIREAIKDVLRSYHLATPNELDQIVKNCSGESCYSQYSIGYDNARVFLMGYFYLVDHGNGQYGVRDTYCNNEKTAEDFNSSKGPGPNRIPNPNIINVEHTWPQSKFSGRYDRSMQKSDLHHLFPTDSQANSTRGNYNFGEVAKDTQQVRCKASRFGIATDGTRDIFEPPTNHKGNVARALFYFSLRYDMKLNDSEEAYLRKWSKEDPIDEEERVRNEEIFKVQKNRNPFIDIEGLEERIANF